MRIATTYLFLILSIAATLVHSPNGYAQTPPLPDGAIEDSSAGIQQACKGFIDVINSSDGEGLNNPHTITHNGTIKLRTSKLLVTLSAAQIQSQQERVFSPYKNPLDSYGRPSVWLPSDSNGKMVFPRAKQDVDVYYITYNSTNTTQPEQPPTVLSGLVAFPRAVPQNDILIYMHATQFESDIGAPSYPSSEACNVLTLFSGQNYAVVLPDYLGYGYNKDLHPYPLGKLNAASAIDMLKAVNELRSTFSSGTFLDSQKLYITGYSEGGANALWLARLLEENPGLPQPSLIAPMAGNYDMTGAMTASMMVALPNDGFNRIGPITRLMSLQGKSLLMMFAAQAGAIIANTPLSSLILPKMETETPQLPWQYNNTLKNLCGGNNATCILNPLTPSLNSAAKSYGYFPDKYPLANNNPPSVLLNPLLISAFGPMPPACSKPDKSNPLVGLWLANNNLPSAKDWTPKAPIYVTGIFQDTLVPFAGSSYTAPAGFSAGPAPYLTGNAENLIGALSQQNAKAGWIGINAAFIRDKITVIKQASHVSGLIPVGSLVAQFIERGKLDSTIPQFPYPHIPQRCQFISRSPRHGP